MSGLNASLTNIVFDQVAMELLLRSPQGPTGRHIAEICRGVERRAVQNTNYAAPSTAPDVAVDTGRLSGSLTHVIVEEGREVVGFVGSNVDYALHVHNKDRPYLEMALDDEMASRR